MTMFLSEDVRTRTASASNTTEFFTQEASRLAAEVEKLEGEISAYKEANTGSLPDYIDMNMQMLERTNDDLTAAQAALNATDEQIRSSQTLLASVFSGAGEQGGPAQKIAELKTQLAQLKSQYQEAHPEIRAMRSQIASLEAQIAPSKEYQRLDAARRAADIALGEARNTLPDGDPAIAEKKAALTAAEDAVVAQLSRDAASSSGDIMSTQIQAQISILQSRRRSLEEQVTADQTKISDLRTRIDGTPAVESALSALQQNRDNIYKQYQEVLTKQQAAQLSENLEDNQKAEKFSILESAQLPERPSSPERAKLGVLALFFALGCGAAAAAGAEFLTATIRGRSHVSKVLGAEPIAIIPDFRRDKAPPMKWFGRRGAPAAAAAAAAAAVVAIPMAMESAPAIDQGAA